MTQPLYIVDGVRTPFCKIGTDLADLNADELGRIVVSDLLARTGVDPDSIDEVILGCVGQPAHAANLARVVALRAGLPGVRRDRPVEGVVPRLCREPGADVEGDAHASRRGL